MELLLDTASITREFISDEKWKEVCIKMDEYLFRMLAVYTPTKVYPMVMGFTMNEDNSEHGMIGAVLSVLPYVDDVDKDTWFRSFEEAGAQIAQGIWKEGAIISAAFLMLSVSSQSIGLAGRTADGRCYKGAYLINRLHNGKILDAILVAHTFESQCYELECFFKGSQRV